MAGMMKDLGQGVGDAVAAVEGGAVGEGFKVRLDLRGFHGERKLLLHLRCRRPASCFCDAGFPLLRVRNRVGDILHRRNSFFRRIERMKSFAFGGFQQQRRGGDKDDLGALEHIAGNDGGG